MHLILVDTDDERITTSLCFLKVNAHTTPIASKLGTEGETPVVKATI